MSYIDLGYDAFLQRLPLPSRREYSALEFDSLIEQEGVDTSNILKNFYAGDTKIYDKNGNLVIDKYGLVSENQFKFGTVTGTGQQSTATEAPSYDTVNGLNISFTLERAAQVLFLVDVQGAVNATKSDVDDHECWTFLYLDGITVVGSVMELYGFEYGEIPPPGGVMYGQAASFHSVETLDSGVHTVQLYFATTQDIYVATMFRHSCRITYMVLGK